MNIHPYTGTTVLPFGQRETYTRSVERIMLLAQKEGARIIGLTSPQGRAGVSVLSTAIARAFAETGARTSLVDVSQHLMPARVMVATPPDHPGAAPRSDSGTDLTLHEPTAPNSISGLRDSLLRDFGDGGTVIVDLPPVLSGRLGGITPLTAASACDLVFVVYMAGITSTTRLKEAVDTLQSVGCRVPALIMNDYSYTPPGREFGRWAARALRFWPRLARWVERRSAESELLN